MVIQPADVKGLMSALVRALVLAPVPDLDAAGLVRDARRLARHAQLAGAGRKAFDQRGG